MALSRHLRRSALRPLLTQSGRRSHSGNFDKSNVAALVLPLVTTSALGLLY